MAIDLLVDTDVMIDFLRGRSNAVAFVTKNSPRIVLSSIVVAELYAGVKGDAEQEILDDLLALFRPAVVTEDIARAAGLLKRDYAGSHGVGPADAILAATALTLDARLCTLNVRHYPMLKGLRPAYKK